jgi:uncharacterized membrane protein (UPF0127 family)
MNWKKHIPIIIIVFLLAGLFMRPGGCPGPAGSGRPPDARIVEISAAGLPEQGSGQSPLSYTIHAEVADTAAARRQGLSGRRGLEPGYGMLYVYSPPAAMEFTEQGTAFPLSVAFLRQDGTVLGIHQTVARDPGRFSPPEPLPYVLEVREGWFADRGIVPGDRLVMPDGLLPLRTEQALAPDVPAETPDAFPAPPGAPAETAPTPGAAPDMPADTPAGAAAPP